MFQKKLKNDLEDEFGQALQDREANLKNPQQQNRKRLMLINEAQIETLKNGNWQNLENSPHTLRENSSWQNNSNSNPSFQDINSQNPKSKNEGWQIGLKNPRNLSQKPRSQTNHPEYPNKTQNKNSDLDGLGGELGDNSYNLEDNQENSDDNFETYYDQNENGKLAKIDKNSQNNSQNWVKKDSGRNKLANFLKVFLILILLGGIGFGGFWLYRTELSKNEKIATECSKVIFGIDKDLELTCQKVDNSVLGFWNNQKIAQNLEQNKTKIETAKITLNGEIESLQKEINTKIAKIETAKLTAAEKITEFKKEIPKVEKGENNSTNFLENLKIKSEQKIKIDQLNLILTTNIERKAEKLDKIINQNLDLEIALADYQNYLKNLQVSLNLKIAQNTLNQNIDFAETSAQNSTENANLKINKTNLVAQTDELESKTRELESKIEEVIKKNPEKNKQRLLKLYKNLTGVQFKEIYNNFSYQKVNEKTKEIVILKDKIADEYIVKIVEKRGYLKRAQADESKLEEIDGQKLQTEAKKAYEELKTEAKKEGLDMVMVSGYRGVKEQQGIFADRLGNLATVATIKSGKSDVILEKILQTTSIPGYSRHHTGYTFDLGCASTELTIFKDTKCYEWLSKDNYLNAKRFGLIPSYPEGGGVQGPDPEAWEYVWVGLETLQNPK